MIQILALPFLICVLMSSILGYFGIHVLRRKIIFIDITLAQTAAVGSIIAHLVFDVHGDSLVAYLCSLGCVLLTFVFYAAIRNRIVQISLEAVIGVSYAIAAAAALFLVGIAPGGHIHVQQMLSGNLLWANWTDVVVSLLVFSTVGLCVFIIRKPLADVSDNCQQALSKRIGSIMLWDFIFYLLLGIVITLSVRMGGIVVVFSYLIIPATISMIISSRLFVQMIIIWAAAIVASITGLLFCYCLDFSIGPSIALFLGCELVLIAIFATFLKGVDYRKEDLDFEKQKTGQVSLVRQDRRVQEYSAVDDTATHV